MSGMIGDLTERTVRPEHAGALTSLGPALAIDSSLGTSVAVSNGARMVTLSVDDHLRHAEVVATLIQRALAEAGVVAAEIRAVIAGMGPGPFTGLRVGIAAAQGFAAGRKRSVLPLVSHEAVALAAFAAEPDRAEAFVVTDARRKEFFGTRFARPDTDGLPVLVAEPQLFARVELGEAEDSTDPFRIDPTRVPADALIELAALKMAAGREFEPNTALYLRSPDVTAQHTPKRVGT